MKKYLLIISTILLIILLVSCGKTDAAEIDTDNADKIIVYNGKEYKVSELSQATLDWLELSEQERLFSSYLPPEFLEITETWGVTLSLENVTSTGATIRCTRWGGEPTGELQTGSWYIIERWTQAIGWQEADRETLSQDLAWTMEAWMIPVDGSTEWDVNWEFLYGKLPAGKYRIGKEIMDFRGPGDYDTAVYFAEFEITE